MAFKINICKLCIVNMYHPSKNLVLPFGDTSKCSLMSLFLTFYVIHWSYMHIPSLDCNSAVRAYNITLMMVMCGSIHFRGWFRTISETDNIKVRHVFLAVHFLTEVDS